MFASTRRACASSAHPWGAWSASRQGRGEEANPPGGGPRRRCRRTRRRGSHAAWSLDESGGAIGRKRAGSYRRRPDGGHAESVELGERRARHDDVRFGVSAHIGEVEACTCLSSERPREREPFGSVSCQASGWAAQSGSASASHMPKSGSSSSSQPPGTSHDAMRRSIPGLSGTCINTARAWKEIERPLRKRVGTHVVTDHFYGRGADRVEEVGLDVRRGHMAFRPYTICKPTCHRATAAADLQAPRPRADAESLEAPDGHRIEPLLEQLEAARLVLGGMRKRVVRRLAHTDQSQKESTHCPGTLDCATSASRSP